jgi:nicotinic acid mononucleotide adenylyltransferase
MTVVAGAWSVSSSQVRAALAAGGDAGDLLPAAVQQYIARRRLYRSG